MAKRVLLFTQWFDPEPTFKGLLFAKELVKKGYEVEVVTGFPNYPEGIVYEGYKIKWIQKEVIDGVNVTRLPLYPSHDSSAIKRILNFISFAITALFYNLFFLKQIFSSNTKAFRLFHYISYGTVMWKTVPTQIFFSITR